MRCGRSKGNLAATQKMMGARSAQSDHMKREGRRTRHQRIEFPADQLSITVWLVKNRTASRKARASHRARRTGRGTSDMGESMTLARALPQAKRRALVPRRSRLIPFRRGAAWDAAPPGTPGLRARVPV